MSGAAALAPAALTGAASARTESQVGGSVTPGAATGRPNLLNTCSPDDDDPFALFVSWHPPHDHTPGQPESNGYLAPEPF